MQQGSLDFPYIARWIFDGNIESDIQLSLEDAWAYYIETGCSLFMACDALSMENNSCVLDMEDLTPTEEADIYKALKGR